MFDHYLDQLASPDVTERRQAIIALGKSADLRALVPLANIYKNDPDPTLRELALKAGRYLKGLTASIPSAAPFTTTPATQSMLTNAPAAEIVKPKEVTFAERQKAKSRVDYAIGLVAEGKNEKALAELVDALHINPELASDQVALNLASSLTGLASTAEAMDVIVNKAQALTKKKNRVRETTQIESADDRDQARSDNGSIVLSITILSLFILTAISTVLVRLGILNQLQTVSQVYPLTRAQAQQFQAAANSLRTLPPGDLFVGTALQMVATLINVAIVFGVGTLFGGTGSLISFYNRVLRVRVVMTIVIYAEIGIWYLSAIRAEVPFEAMSQTVGIILAVVLLTYLVETIWESVAVARGHDIGIPSGCITIFIGVIVSAVLLFVLGVALSNFLHVAP